MLSYIDKYDKAKKRLKLLEETGSYGEEYDSGPPERISLEAYLEYDSLGYDLILKFQALMKTAINDLKSATVECEVIAPKAAVPAKKFLQLAEGAEREVFSVNWYEKLDYRDSIFHIKSLKPLRDQAVKEAQKSLDVN